ncbi:MAG: tRNA (adenosine(37)-N6)-threonylcarbamoyltransferase complex dimerization subunit type 1 TsaB [Thiothrix sp.]|nr:MAG: tRNA (adenosine(37)-N6)-threonylcarbamoyltransferase complex dimerization subunit type 1 TsaB [Thiothrix sp.]
MKILALDTSTEACSVALLNGAELHSRYVVQPRKHAALILPMLEEVLTEAGMILGDLDALAFGCGPGSFTGVRIATATAQGVAASVNLTVIPVSSLAAIAQRAVDEKGTEKIACAIDARMGEVYWGCYRQNNEGVVELEGTECVIAPQAVPVPQGSGWTGAGTGWSAYEESLILRMGPALLDLNAGLLPNAAALAKLAAVDFQQGKTVSAGKALPVYLRNQVARKPI